MITRETAKQSIIHDKASEYSHDSFVANIDQVAYLIDAVYDSFEQRICNNCYFNYCGCSIQDSILICDAWATFDTFGCNKFEPCK